MRDKIKKFCKEHQFEVGVATGMFVSYLIGSQAEKRLAAKGYKMTRPVGYATDGTFYARTPSGHEYHVHNHNK